ncbi:alpha/beta fold hydrolase, partial [Pseudomonas aeruginosa]
MSTAVEIACRDGVRLAGDHFPAVGDAQGSIVVACALGVRRAFYQRFAVLAAASGYEVLLFSYRGSEGDDPAVASYRLADWGREDIDAALAWCRARAPELPRYFVGHSIGAQLLGLAGQASGLSGAAFVAGSFPYWRRWRGRQRWQMFGLFCVAVPLLTGLLRRFPSRFFGLGSLDMPSLLALME